MLTVAGLETLEWKGIKSPECERMPVNEHEGRLFAIGHSTSLHRRVAHHL
jgi:hypothetical protein